MTEPVLVTYASKHGSTAEVAETIAGILRDEGVQVDVKPVSAVPAVDGYAAVVLGCSLYMGRPHAAARRFLSRQRSALSRMPFAVFAMGPLTSGDEDMLRSRAQLDATLEHLPELVPVAVAVFGGVVDPAQLHFPFNRMAASDARDWPAIGRWARELVGALAPAAAPV